MTTPIEWTRILLTFYFNDDEVSPRLEFSPGEYQIQAIRFSSGRESRPMPGGYQRVVEGGQTVTLSIPSNALNQVANGFDELCCADIQIEFSDNNFVCNQKCTTIRDLPFSDELEFKFFLDHNLGDIVIDPKIPD